MSNINESPIKLLVVTRENNFDKRYGLAKSLNPVLAQLARSGVEIRYLCQAEVTLRNERFLRSLHAKITATLGWLLSDSTSSNFFTLSWAILERLNMGRLAALVERRDGFSHVHCHDPLIAAGYQAFRRSRDARHGLTQHGYGSYTQALHEDGVELGPWIMRRMRNWESRVLKRADWVIAPSCAGLNQLARDLGIYPIPTHWVSIVHPKPHLPELPREQARALLGWTDDRIQIISVGRLVPLKDFGTLIDALAKTKSKRHWQLTILGDGDWSALQAYADRQGIPKGRLHFASADDISRWYIGADLYVSTSLTESFGMANHEAICCGLPSILTAVAAVPETAKDAASYVPAKDSVTLARTLERLIDNDVERAQLAQRARAMSAHWPSVQWIGEAYLACYQGRQKPDIDSGDSQRALPAAINFDQWRPVVGRLPLFQKPKPLDINTRSRVLVFAPHMDDETFSLGGTLVALKKEQCSISVALMTYQPERMAEFVSAKQALGIDHHYCLDGTDGDLNNDDSLRKQIRALMRQCQPNVIFAPPAFDIHRDHLGASLAIAQSWSEEGYFARFFFYEFWQPLVASHYVDITPYKSQKDAAIACYKTPSQHLDYAAICHRLQAFRISIMADQSTDAEAFMEIRPADAQHLTNAHLVLRAANLQA
jgi:glycosyltransferase involved in cell wall biosynthesis/LmbE family N-acetylglucosaminyl deacetylase